MQLEPTRIRIRKYIHDISIKQCELHMLLQRMQ